MISVPGAEKLSLVEIEAFLSASESVRFAGCGRAELCQWVEHLLCHHEYPRLGRRSKGLLRAYIERMTGFSRAQSTRLIGGCDRSGPARPKVSLRARFPRRRTPADVELLASRSFRSLAELTPAAYATKPASEPNHSMLQAFDRVNSHLGIFGSQVSKSRPGAPGDGAQSSGQSSGRRPCARPDGYE